MSQAKVDKRKYEKHNRKKLEKQRKVRFAMKCVAAALVIGAIIGVPLGINIYRSIPKFVGDSVFSAYVGNYIDEHYADEVSLLNQEEESSEETADDESDMDELEDDIREAGDTSTEELSEDGSKEGAEESSEDGSEEGAEESSEDGSEEGAEESSEDGSKGTSEE